MPAHEIAFHVQYAAVHAAAGGDAEQAAADILREQRVLAAVRVGDQPSVLIPVTESGHAVALGDGDRLRFDLPVEHLRELFAAQGLHLDMHSFDDPLDAIDAELDDAFGEAFEELDGEAMPTDDLDGFGDAADEDDFDDEPLPGQSVRVIEFSRRGPWAARITAQLLGTEVAYVEHGTWSAYLYRTSEPHAVVTGRAADGAVIELNLPEQGDAWVEVTAGGRTGMFWPNAERVTRPVLDLDSITDRASADVYRRMLADADGAREELREIAAVAAVDMDAAHRAGMPEAVGGVVGESERLAAFLAAFGVPEALVARALREEPEGTSAGADAGTRRFSPRGWPGVLGDLVVGGISETTPLPMRERPLPRLARALRERPLLGAAVSTAELTAGLALSRARSPLARGLGVFVVIDAVIDLLIWAARMRRR